MPRTTPLWPLAAALMLLQTATATAEMDATERQIADWVDANSEAAFSLLEETVNLGSGTMNHDGVRAVGAVMRRELDALGLVTDWVDMPPEVNRAGHLFGRSDSKRGPRILMIGHLDTVFESDDDFQSFVRDGDTAIGPGVDDMKSGNVIMVYALKALREAGVLDELSVVAAYTGDEEKTGSPLSITRKELIEAGEWADVALGFESGVHYDGSDWATIARRSSSSWLLTVTGRQAHSSGIFRDDVGAGAIFEAARILNAFYDEVRGEEYLSFNAGTIQGGTNVDYDPEQNRGTTFGKTNVVPNTVVVHGGMRAISLDQLERARDKMRAVVARSHPQTSATIEFVDRYPPMAPTEGNQRLQLLLSNVNEDLGRGEMPALDPARRGAADISFVAPMTDALAGLGAIGTGGHTPDETLDLTTMPLAIKRAAIFMYRLTRESHQD